MNKISAVYKITNTITGDFYIGSSIDVKRRWRNHKCQSVWKRHSNNPMYLDMQKYGVEKFEFQILAEVESEHLKETEQKFIELLKPTYNNYNAKGWDIERHKEYMKEYNKSDKRKEYMKEYRKEYNKYDKRKEYMKEYNKSDKRKEYMKEYRKEYNNQPCLYNGKHITLNALRERFRKSGIENPTLEAKKYLINN